MGDVATITNAGAMSGAGRYGVWLTDGGEASGQTDGMIRGGNDGIYLGKAGTVSNIGSHDATLRHSELSPMLRCAVRMGKRYRAPLRHRGPDHENGVT